jgi:hypothetical protein
MNKHSSLLQKFINYGQKSFITLGQILKDIDNIFLNKKRMESNIVGAIPALLQLNHYDFLGTKAPSKEQL